MLGKELSWSWNRGKVRLWKPKLAWERGAGEGGGLAQRQSLEPWMDAGAGTNEGAKVGGDGPWPDLGRCGNSDIPKVTRFSAVLSSTSSDQLHIGGAEAGPGVTAWPGVEFPRRRLGLRAALPCDSASSPGRGAVCGSLGLISMASADSVSLCLVGLLPGRDR